MTVPAEEFAFSLRSERPLRSETCLAASEAASVSSGSGAVACAVSKLT